MKTIKTGTMYTATHSSSKLQGIASTRAKAMTKLFNLMTVKRG